MITLSPADLSLVEKYRPKTLDDVVGQPRIVKFLKSYATRPISKAFILHGPSGTGKTSAAMALARDLGVVVEDGPFGGFWEIKAGEQTIDSLRDLMRKVPVTHGFGCVGSGHKMILVEEADRCSKEVATWWLGAIEEIKRNVPRCTIVFTTNHPGKMDGRMLSRFSAQAFNGSRDDMLSDIEKLIARIWVAETGREDAPPELNEFSPEITINDSDDVNVRAVVEQLEDYLIENEIGRKQVEGLTLVSEPAAKPGSLFGYVGQFATKEFPKVEPVEQPKVVEVEPVAVEQTNPTDPINPPSDPFATITLDASRPDYHGTARDVATIGPVDVMTESVNPACVDSVETTDKPLSVASSKPAAASIQAQPVKVQPIPVHPPSAVFGATKGRKPRKGSLESIMATLGRNQRLADHAKDNPGTPIHPFTLAGLGTAPFKHLDSFDLGAIDSYCDCCGTPIRFVATIQSAEGQTSKVGHVCLDRHAIGTTPAEMVPAMVAC